MRMVVIPHSTELKVLVNPDGRLDEKAASFYLPGLYEPWPEARERGFAEIELGGETLRTLLTEISSRYKKVGIDYDPICPYTNDVKMDFDVWVNGTSYVLISNCLDIKLKRGDEITIIENSIGHC